MSKLSVTRVDLWRILIAGAIVAVLDATFAFVVYVVIAGRYNFESLLQYTASGLLGNGAFGHSGPTGWLIAGLGLSLHVAISLAVAAVFFMTVSRFANTTARMVGLGLLYGAAVWMFNAGVVLPATGTRHEPFFGGWYIPFLVEHALFVGLPVAIVLGRAPRRTQSRSSMANDFSSGALDRRPARATASADPTPALPTGRRRIMARTDFRAVLRRAGYSMTEADSVLRGLPDPIDFDRDGEGLFTSGVSLDRLIDRMGGSP